MTLPTHIVPDLNAVAEYAVHVFYEQYQIAVQDRGRLVVGLSGGSTPRAFYKSLREQPLIDWSRIDFTFTDERFVPLDHEESNFALANLYLFQPIGIHPSQVTPLIQADDPVISAQLAEERLTKQFGDHPLLDIAFLGLGEDGHTASLFSGEPGVQETRRDIIAANAPVNAPVRITMTPPILNRARRTIFLVSGENKQQALWRCVEGPVNFDETPAQAIARFAWRPEVIADEASAKLILNRFETN
jgi:6-phosphogluconolactonase